MPKFIATYAAIPDGTKLGSKDKTNPSFPPGIIAIPNAMRNPPTIAPKLVRSFGERSEKRPLAMRDKKPPAQADATSQGN